LKSEEKRIADEGRNKLLTKKAKKSAAKTTTAPTSDRKDEEDSSSSDSDSSSSSSSSESEDEDAEKKPMGRTRLDQDSELHHTEISPVKPHKQMIKFRQGRGSPQTKGVSVTNQSVTETKLEVKSQDLSVALEWWEKPSKYCRETIDETEIDQINSGGASRLFQ